MTTIVSAETNPTKVIIKAGGAKGLTGDGGANGTGLNDIRYSLLDNPLCNLLKTNKLTGVSAPTNTDADASWVRATSATYVDRYGIVKTAAINEPREEKEGFLFEGISTNLLLHSDNFGDAAWSSAGVTITPNYSTSPDGTNNATRLIYSGASILLGQPTSMIVGSVCSASIWIKGVAGETIALAAGGVDQLHALNGEWQRIKTENKTSVSSFLYLNTYLGATARDVEVWNSQLESMPLVSSTIKTTTSEVTRSADQLSIVGNNNCPLLTGDNSIYFTVKTIGFNQDSQCVMSAPATSSFSRALLFFGGNTTSLISYTASNAIDIPVSSQLDSNSIASVYSGESLKGYANGQLVVDSVSPYTDAPSSNIIYIGYDGSSSFLFGHIKDFRIYDFALNANEVAYLNGE